MKIEIHNLEEAKREPKKSYTISGLVSERNLTPFPNRMFHVFVSLPSAFLATLSLYSNTSCTHIFAFLFFSKTQTQHLKLIIISSIFFKQLRLSTNPSDTPILLFNSIGRHPCGSSLEIHSKKVLHTQFGKTSFHSLIDRH